jgi:hypothetical protein
MWYVNGTRVFVDETGMIKAELLVENLAAGFRIRNVGEV